VRSRRESIKKVYMSDTTRKLLNASRISRPEKDAHQEAKSPKCPLAILIAVMVAYPFLPFNNNYWIDVGFFVGIYALLGLSLNIMLGEVGLFNLGQAAFYAIGAYTRRY